MTKTHAFFDIRTTTTVHRRFFLPHLNAFEIFFSGKFCGEHALGGPTRFIEIVSTAKDKLPQTALHKITTTAYYSKGKKPQVLERYHSTIHPQYYTDMFCVLPSCLLKHIFHKRPVGFENVVT